MNIQPIIFNPKESSLENFQKQYEVRDILDTYHEQLKELFLIRNPHFRFDKNYETQLQEFLKEYSRDTKMDEMGTWFYFPWMKTLVHYLSDELHQEIRTARNRNLIMKEEQNQFYNFTIGIAGLSVGSHVALTIAMMGGGRVMKLADPDAVSASNLNRIRYGYTKVGINKCELTAQQIYEINPYAELFMYTEGVTLENIDDFLIGSRKIDVLIECLDNLEMKIRLRLKARELGIPVIMATDNGDGVIVDIERYDLNKDLDLFNGVLGRLTLEEFQKFSPRDLPKLATKIAGSKIVVPRMLSSLLEVGKSLYSWPQLGDAATLTGVVSAYIVKRLALKEPVKEGKIDISLDAILDPNYDSGDIMRETERKKLLQSLGLLD